MILEIALLAAATTAAAAPTTGPAAPPAKLTLQQRYDRAKELAVSGQCREAVAEADILEKTPSFKAGSLPAAMITVLKGKCHIRMGQSEQGEIEIQQGLPRLRKESPALDVDVASALLALGDAAMTRWDYAGAKRQYETAAAIPNATDGAVMNIKLAQATAFDGSDAALAYASEAVRLVKETPGIEKTTIAEFRTLHARILLNQGRNAEAYKELKEVLTLNGGLKLKVTLADIAMRGDLALAAKLSGDDANAREYLAYTGAGRIAQSPFSRALFMDPPVCGAQTGLRPGDFAVVDFAIGPDAQVLNANTVYTRGSADVAAAFARAVSQWVWDPKDLKDIPAFYLLSSRIEIRCTTVGQQAPSVASPLQSRFLEWAMKVVGIKHSDFKDNGQPESDPRLGFYVQLEAIALAAPATDDPARQLALLLLRSIRPVDASSYVQMLDKAIMMAAHPEVPAEVRNYLKVSQWMLRKPSKLPSKDVGDLLAMLATPELADDALAADTVRLLLVVPKRPRDTPDNAVDLLQQVATDKRLPEQDQLRQVANLELANIAAKKGDFAKALEYFRATGLTEEQCAFIGVKPALRRSNVSSDDFPMAALQYGFEGWVSLEFDVQDSGVPVGIRPLISYPPFVFSDAAAKSAKDFRFEASYRPNGGNACNAQRQTIAYHTP